ncbi:MAG: hypothetical protein JXA54_00345 [Candidatus Heimdallarchaeota archaeon]|nr:hypothetical protein [Candidatus Heimdallarchaeota archaeon]
MSFHRCDFCENESRFICVKCKKDICKNHAVYEKDPDDSNVGNWVCIDCHQKTQKSNLLFAVIAIVLFIIILIVGIVLLKQFTNLFSIFP